MIPDHEIEKLAGFRTHFPVHMLRFGRQFLRRADGIGVSLREQQGFVVEAQTVHAQTPALFLADLRHGRGDDLPDLGAETGGVLLRIVETLPLQIGQVRIAVKPQLRSHGRPLPDQLVILPVQFRADPGVKPRPGQEGFPPFRPVRALHDFQQAIEVALFPPELRDGLRGFLFVLLAYFPLPDDFRDDPLIRSLYGCVDQPHHLRPELLLKVRTETGAGQRLMPALHERDQRGALLSEPFHLFRIKNITGIDGVAHRAQGPQGAQLNFLFLQGKVSAPRLPVGSRVFKRPDRAFIAVPDRVHIRPRIRHLPKINHAGFPPFLPPPPYIIPVFLSRKHSVAITKTPPKNGGVLYVMNGRSV